MIGRLALIPVAALAACGPPSPEAAARICEQRARESAGPTGSIGMGVGSSGVITDVDLTISSDFVRGRDPQQVYDDCIARRTTFGARMAVDR